MLSRGLRQEQPVQVCAQGLALRRGRRGPGPRQTAPGLENSTATVQQPFMRDFLQIKESFALISLSGIAVCAFQDKPSPSRWLPLRGSSPRTVGRGGLYKPDYPLKPWGTVGSRGVL